MSLSDEDNFDKLKDRMIELQGNMISTQGNMISANENLIVSYKGVIDAQSERIKKLENTITEKDSVIAKIKTKASSSSLTLPDFKCPHCEFVIVNPKKICLSCGNDIREESKYWRFTKNYEKALKDNQEALKSRNITISSLEDDIEKLKQRIEKGKEIWEENKRLKEKIFFITNIIFNEVPKPYINNIMNRIAQNRKLAQSNEPTPVSISLPNPENDSMPKLPLPSNNQSLSPDKEDMDYTKSYAHVFREHGRFGSHPSHDDFGDESTP